MKVNNIIILVWIIILINALSIVMGDNVIKGDCVTKEGELVNSGFVFLDGKYINSPYIVSQRGFNLYINEPVA